MEYYVDLRKAFIMAQNAAEEKRYSDAAIQMRRIAEYIAEFYVEKRKLKDFREQLRKEKKKSNWDKETFMLNLQTLRQKTRAGTYGFFRELLTFLDLARKFGNIGAHTLKQPEHYDIFVKNLVFFYNDYLRSEVEKDCETASVRAAGDSDDVTAKFMNKRIRIYSCVSSCFASSRVDMENEPICCNIEEPDAWETFTVCAGADNWAALKAFNGKYVTVRKDFDDELPPLCLYASEPDDWELFKIYRCGSLYCIKAKCNNKWITCRADFETLPLIASCDEVDFWEKFDISTV